MKLKDIDINSDKYDLQRGKDMKLCIKMWDYNALVKDVKQCEDYDKDTCFVRLMQLTGGILNPGQLKKALEKLNHED